MAPYVRIEPENCKGCGLCLSVCPTNQLSFSGKFNSHSYNYIQASNLDCKGCGFCYYTCPEPGAIKVYPAQDGKGGAA